MPCSKVLILTFFRPLARTDQFEGKFWVFSGGKLDFRKGQDIVLAAFKRFAENHKDAVLVTAWQNLATYGDADEEFPSFINASRCSTRRVSEYGKMGRRKWRTQ